MADKIQKFIEYVAKIDKSSFTKLATQQQQLNRQQIKAGNEIVSINQDARKALLSQVKARKDNRDETNKQIKAEQTRLEILEKQNSELRRDVGSIGDVDSALSAIRGGAGALTGTDLGVLEGAAGLFELGEAAVQLRGAVPSAVESVKNLGSSIGASGVGLVGALGVLTVALAAASTEAQRRAELAKVVIDSQKEYFEIVQSGTSESISVARESAKEQLEAAKQELQTRKDQREQINQEIGAMTGFFQGVVQAGISAGITGGEVKQLDTTIQELEKTVLENELAVKNYDDALESAKVKQNDLTKTLLADVDAIGERRKFENQVTSQSVEQNVALNQELLKQNDIIAEQINTLRLSGDSSESVKERMAELYEQLVANDEQLAFLRNTAIPYTQQLADEEEAKEKLIEQSKKREQIDKQRESTLSRLTSLEDAANKALEDFALKQSEITQDRQIRDIRELEDYNTEVAQAQQEHNREVANIVKDGNKDIANIRNSISGLESDFYKDEIDAQKTYQKDLRKLSEQYQREDKQQLDDHLASLRDAEQSNDVIAFLQSQRSFQQEQAEKQSTRSQEFKELNEEYQEQRRLRQEAFNERRAELQQELALSRQQTQERLNEARNAFQQEQALRAQERQRDLQRRAQDDAIADQRNQQALQRQLQAIDQKAQAELNAIRQVTSAVGQLEAVARRISASASGGSSGRSSYSGSSALGSKSYERNGSIFRSIQSQTVASNKTRTPVRTAFADGGIADRPTLAMVGEGGKPEAIIPFNKSRGLPAALRDYGLTGSRSGGSPIVNLQFAPNLTVGDIATGNEVSRALQEFATDLERQLYQGINKAVNQTA